MLEKLVLFVLIERLSSRALDARRAADGHWTQLILELSRSAQIKTSPEVRGIRDEEVNAGGGWGYELSKRAFDAFLAFVFLAAALPLCLVVALLIFLDSPGPVLFRQERVGRGGRIFKIYKFRSMHVEASGSDVSPTSSADPRITGAGRWLRRCSLDELPQLLNVVKGEMSLAGPRPEMRFLVNQHRSAHRQRLQVTPGMTGLWQLSPARATRIHENPHYDLYYVRNRSFCMDLAILLYTPVLLMRGISSLKLGPMTAAYVTRNRQKDMQPCVNVLGVDVSVADQREAIRKCGTGFDSLWRTRIYLRSGRALRRGSAAQSRAPKGPERRLSDRCRRNPVVLDRLAAWVRRHAACLRPRFSPRAWCPG